MKMKRVGIIVLAVLLALSAALSGCGSKNGQSDNTNTTGQTSGAGDKNKAPISLALWTGYPELDPWLNKMAEEYSAANPNVKIEIVSFPLRDFEKKVATALPTKTCAEIISSDAVQAMRYIQEGMMVKAPDNLAEFVKSGVYNSTIVNDSQYEGIVYGIPHMLGTSALYYNTDMFKEAGLTDPPKSMEELTEYAKKLAKSDSSGKLSRSGFSLRLSGGGSGVGEKFGVMLMQNGGTIVEEVSPGKYRAGYNSDAGLKTLQMYVDMVHKYHTDDPAIKHDAEAFEMGATAMFVRETWVINDIASKAPDLNYKTAPLFKANLANVNRWYVTNSAEGDKSQTVWDFVKFIMEPENHKQMVTMSGWLPARNDLDMADYIAKNPAFEAYFKEYDKIYTTPQITEFDEILTKFADRLANYGFTDSSFVDNPDKMKTFLADCAKETNNILKENGHLAE